MQHINKRFILSLATLLVVCGASLSGTALAEHGGGSESGTSSSGSNNTTESHVETADASSTSSSDTENEQETQHSMTLRDQFKQTAQTKIKTEMQDKAKVHTAAQRKQSCEARKTHLTNRMNNAVAAAQRHKQVFDSIYTKIKNFHDSKNLNVANYTTLTAAADAAQQDAADQIAALKALDISVDCTQTDSLATNISAFQTAVKSTRDSLKAYRKALVAITTALHGASTSTDKTKDSSTNTTTTQ